VNGGCGLANITDASFTRKYPQVAVATCDDLALNTTRVGSYGPNAFGLHDTIGNVQEWVEDCATDSYDSMPLDGRANPTGDCARRVVRSSSWGTLPKDTRVANRVRYPRGQTDDSVGIRVAKTLPDDLKRSR
jgi:formylglycine-generating enzyme required for sulfatase activity